MNLDSCRLGGKINYRFTEIFVNAFPKKAGAAALVVVNFFTLQKVWKGPHERVLRHFHSNFAATLTSFQIGMLEKVSVPVSTHCVSAVAGKEKSK